VTEITFSTDRDELRGYLARPQGAGPWPGVVVIHDIFGLNNDLRRQCEWLASEGFLALGPDLFSRASKVSCLRSIVMDLRARRGPTFDAIEAARARLVADERCTGRVGIIGYCIGGGYSLLLAPDHHYVVSSVNYGDVPNDIETVLAGACPVVASYGAKDRLFRGKAAKLEKALTVNGVAHDVKEYPDAGHGFLNEHEGKVAAFIGVVGRLTGISGDEPSAQDARRRIIDFFSRYLKGN
jgi:carboxymethylenebutenolidase